MDPGGHRLHALALPRQPWRAGNSEVNGLEACDTGIAVATAGVADVHVVRSVRTPGSTPSARLAPLGELLFVFVLAGALDIEGDAGNAANACGHHRLSVGDSCVILADAAFSLRASGGMSMLKVAL